MLGQSGLDINNSSKKYSLESMPGEFAGLQLLAYMHVGLRQMESSLDIGIGLGLDKKCQTALGMFNDPR